MKANLLLVFILWTAGLLATTNSSEREFEFQYAGVTLHGVLNTPINQEAKGIVILVHGSGATNAVAQQLHYDVRMTLVQAGYSTFMWDKMGCGKSGGTFDYNQTIESSAEEVIAAIQALREANLTGSQSIGLWGISRAGWICPVVINQQPDIKFWISVSGVDDKESFNYLFEQNLQIAGVHQDSIDLLVAELHAWNKICHEGGSYETYLAATANLRENAFWLRFTNGGGNEEGYYQYQKQFMTETLDPATGLKVYVNDFEEMLGRIKCPVLALFGKVDKHVDWRKTKSLYEHTLAPSTDISIQTFPACNHNLFVCKTGGFYEFQDDGLPWTRCPGVLDAMANWLEQL